MSGPHDLFARYTFGHPERAAAELRAALPPHVVSEVDWEFLRRTVRGATGQVLRSVLGTQRAEELMRSYGEELIEQGIQQGLARGRAERRAEDVVRILTARGVHIGDEARRRILTCTDLETLDRWFERALNATTLSNVLEDLAQ